MELAAWLIGGAALVAFSVAVLRRWAQGEERSGDGGFYAADQRRDDDYADNGGDA